MFKPVNIFTAAALGAGILAMHQVQAAPLRTRSVSDILVVRDVQPSMPNLSPIPYIQTSKIFMLAQYNSGDKAFFTMP
jgi:hypothetical protein